MNTRYRTRDAARWLVTEIRASAFARWGLFTALLILFLSQWYLHIDGWATIPATDVRVYAQGGRWALQRWDVYSPAFPSDFTGFLPFSYPPFGAISMLPLGLLPDAWIFPVWTAVSLASLAGILWVAFTPAFAQITAGRTRIAALLVAVVVAIPTGPISELLPFGQIGTMLTLACLLDMVGKTWRIPQGVLVGVMTAVKLTPGLFVVHWLITKQWRPALTSVATLLTCWTVGALWLPTSTRNYLWGERLIVNPTARAARPDLEYNQSIGGLLARLNGGSIPTATYLLLACALCILGLAAGVIAVQARAPITAAAVIGLTSVLVSPVSWTHHAVWLLPAIGAVVGDLSSRGRIAVGVALTAALYYPTRGWMPLESTFDFREVWFTLYCLTIGLLASIAWRSTRGHSRAY